MIKDGYSSKNHGCVWISAMLRRESGCRQRQPIMSEKAFFDSGTAGIAIWAAGEPNVSAH